MSGPFKISLLLLAVGVFALCAQAQEQKQDRKSPGFKVQVGNGQNGQRHPGPHTGDWLRLNRGKSLDQQKQSLQSDPDFKNLPPERQQRLQQRLQNFNSLPPDQQQRILQRIDKFEHMTPQQRAQARALWDRMRLLPEERRGQVRQQIHALAGLAPDQRQKVLNSDQFNRQFNPDERELVQRSLELTDQRGEAPAREENEAPR